VCMYIVNKTYRYAESTTNDDNNNNNNNNNMLAYKAPVCQKTSEAPADRYSQC